ncbi:cutinase transcription factor 1 alpha [Aaosphaeria arxii CBS 175.79]|uniref:Cutinase transcription factor 1 alpha n=1 Tax=Aaosphaeria arxii CBS 175.79 TaxID=1450172 RepID=A0A6A5Y0R4_9PLEO|nr:cutinase transcription factor 1 alpha [Aaosphaeria arxii CBS 175.79]KAF2019135.1 cutinase transcription factor 1 alpha [Aaosphaeria arxii CBS 175.79]
MSDCSGSPSDHHDHTQQPKRKANQAGIDGNTTGRSVKRRASKACQCCRARKVRCNVTEHGAPCTNCRLDEVECIVSESRRKKKWTKDDEQQNETSQGSASSANRKLASRETLDSVQSLNPASASRRSHEAEPRPDEHVPHSIYQSHPRIGSISNLSELQRRLSINSQSNGLSTSMPFAPFGADNPFNYSQNAAPRQSAPELPSYIKPLPARIGADEIAYLEKKGALSLPKGTLRSEMLRAYVEFVHPYMPLLDLYDFLTIIDRPDGSLGKVSLILFQAVMFAGSAFVDMRYLRAAGYVTRKEARKDFFTKTRVSYNYFGRACFFLTFLFSSLKPPSSPLFWGIVGLWISPERTFLFWKSTWHATSRGLLYDFDYDSDRVSLVQALLLLTYYYETPDDQKDTWHWMGVATSVAHTIGLHRNPDNTNMDTKRVKLWKRIWWSTYMRDRLIALGMRRPTRIKTEDFDVPMLTLDDFEITTLPDSINGLPSDCRIAKDLDMQRQLAVMCIEKAKLCLCISHVLSKQYCVLNNNQGLLNDRTTMMLLPKKLDPETSEVKACDAELQKWVQELPQDAKYSDNLTGEAALDLHRALLHMVFFTTLSALHRPQVLPSTQGGAMPSPSSKAGSDLLDVSRRNVRRAAAAITSIAQRLDQQDLVKYLPTTGVTVLLPAIIIHLLDIKAPEEDTRRVSLRGFCQCMAVMGKLRDLYAAADYSTAFLEAAIRKAGIHIAPTPSSPMVNGLSGNSPLASVPKPSPVTSVEDLVDAGRRLDMAALATAHNLRATLTPPPDSGTTNLHVLEKQPSDRNVTDEEVARRLETFLASTPPESDNDNENTTFSIDHPSITFTAADSLSITAAAEKFTGLNGFTDSIPPNPFIHHQDDEMLFSSLPIQHEFDDGDFDSLLNLDAVGETFSFEEGALDGGLQGELGDMKWTGTSLTT